METTLGERLKAALKWAGSNQSQLARDLAEQTGKKLLPKDVNAWCNDNREPGFEYLRRIAKTLGVNGHYLLTGEGSLAPGHASLAEEQIAEIRKLLEVPKARQPTTAGAREAHGAAGRSQAPLPDAETANGG